MYLWIHGLETQQNQIIYVPTEAGLPVLEASRFQTPMQQHLPRVAPIENFAKQRGE